MNEEKTSNAEKTHRFFPGYWILNLAKFPSGIGNYIKVTTYIPKLIRRNTGEFKRISSFFAYIF